MYACKWKAAFHKNDTDTIPLLQTKPYLPSTLINKRSFLPAVRKAMDKEMSYYQRL